MESQLGPPSHSVIRQEEYPIKRDTNQAPFIREARRGRMEVVEDYEIGGES